MWTYWKDLNMSAIYNKSISLFTLKTKVLNQHFKEFGQWLLFIKFDLTFKKCWINIDKFRLNLTPC